MNSSTPGKALLLAADFIERQTVRAGYGFAALNIVLIGAILVQVSLRHFVSGGHQVVLGELEWHLYAVAMMFGLSYAQATGAHVRVDAVARRFSQKTKHWIEIFGILFLAMPFIIVIFLQGLDYVADSWRVNESSDSPVGLPARWFIKSVIPASFALWFFALAAKLMREIAGLLGVEKEADKK